MHYYWCAGLSLYGCWVPVQGGRVLLHWSLLRCWLPDQNSYLLNKGSSTQFQCVCQGGEFLHTTKQFQGTSWGSYNSSQFWHCPHGESIRAHSLRALTYKTSPSYFRCQSWVQVITCSCDQLLYIRGSSDFLLGFNKLLQWLTEVTETFYLLEYQFIIKSYNSGTGEEKHRASKA